MNQDINQNTLSSNESNNNNNSIITNVPNDVLSVNTKKSKLNNTQSKVALNCDISLESNARQKFADMIDNILMEKYDINLREFQPSAQKKKKKNIDWSENLVHKQLSRPRDRTLGELCLMCYPLCKQLFGNSKKVDEFAAELVVFLNELIVNNSGPLLLLNPFEKCTLGKNGRVNVQFTSEYLGSIIPLILDINNCYLSRRNANGTKVMVEYSSPNTHKSFHVGHMRNVALGDCLIRLFEHCGYSVTAANYFGDEGAHVAKCLWMLKKTLDKKGLDFNALLTADDVNESKNDEECLHIPIDNRGEWLGDLYTKAVTALDLSAYTKFPFPGVIVGRVVSVSNHPHSESPAAWHVVEVDGGIHSKGVQTVICGGTEYNVNDLIAYVPVGEKYKGKVAVSKDLKGVISNGVIMSAMELGFNLPSMNVNNQIIDEIKEEKVGKGKKKKKKSKKKQKAIKDERIFLVQHFYPNAKIGDSIIDVGSYKIRRENEKESIEEMWKRYNLEQREILQKMENGDKEICNLWNITKQWSLQEFKRIYKWLQARFDVDFYESKCSEESRAIVDEHYKEDNSGPFVKSDGAIGCQLGGKLGFCMLLKSDGSGLYATKDLALAKQKFEQFGIDRSIYVVDASQSHHLQQVFATLQRIGYKQASKCHHFPYGLVVLPGPNKMSSRLGNVIAFNELVQLLSSEINDKFLNGIREKNDYLRSTTDAVDMSDIWSDAELMEAERAISVGVIRYGMLNHDNNKDVVFDLKKWALQTGNTGVYLMYQCARIRSIERKVEFPMGAVPDFSLLTSAEERFLLFEMSQFQSKVENICENMNPSALCDYLYYIAKKFSQWYSKDENSIKNCKDIHLQATRLLFSKCVAETISVGIQLLGIQPLERM